ncbi:MAG: methylated-DNA--[protein]-cysteine S-methyltransferase [Anaerolineae bacterium]
MAYFAKYQTAIGCLGVVDEDGCITQVFLPSDAYDTAGYTSRETALLVQTFTQLQQYFLGERRSFKLPLAPRGTPFMHSVWDALLSIPYGKTATYAQVANLVGHPRAYRAVGLANHNNPIPILIPCHRVIGAHGELTGYRGGLEVKEYLLHLEKYASQESILENRTHSGWSAPDDN